MFLLYAVVPVFVFTVLLNFFTLYSTIDSLQSGEDFQSCQECLCSTCHKESLSWCTVNSDNVTYQCFTCEEDPTGHAQYYTEEDCQYDCTDDCVCDGACYMCIDLTNINPDQYTCDMPTQAVDEQCTVIPYDPDNAPSSTTVPVTTSS